METTRRDRVGFIGLGRLGTPVARRLLRAGHHVTVWNRTREKTAPLVAEGAAEANSPAGVMRDVGVVFLCVHDAASVERVTFGPGGLAEAATADDLVVDHTSIHPHSTRDLARALAEATGAHWLDAPVSGGVPAAESGTLTVMAGGERADFDRAESYLKAYASKRTLVGPCGAGQAVKLCNQVLIAATVWAIAEATRLAAVAGVDPVLLTDALAGGLGDSPMLRLYQPLMVSGSDTSLGSSVSLLKDLDSCLDISRREDCPLPLTAQVAELFRIACKWTPADRSGHIIDLLIGPTRPPRRDE
ncbi:NAD(P)-dependent oxidoreductase [Actinosynnema sp. NPDC047251]|uniref:3-hydroxyacid dehydrogenase/reductase n=1 Tax=Saccharothrix espanaensis (strain ATCC 51144 / DSM 44229 / JCM 9112 / NBRC 15066 / NRRL 15764) TaxID=1179773 RepID=K0JSJ2_SACES|nr:NAD(P)-dependent oxidoreductase [Saccharothrix espanaensis]CCH30655.1 3-hydroxyacid dehydrogenase/reductase [Saccharothrix espanaensis DSM 44229]